MGRSKKSSSSSSSADGESGGGGGSSKKHSSAAHEKRLVYDGKLDKTRSGLRKSDLMISKSGKVVSKKQHAQGLKALKNLKAAGYVAKKGEFKLFKKGDGKKRDRKSSTSDSDSE